MAHLIYLNSYEMNLSDLSHSQICQRVRSVICEAVWEAVRVRSVRPKWEADLWGRGSPIGLSRTPAESPILGAIWLISRLNALPHTVESDRTSDSVTASQIGLSRTDLAMQPIGLSNLWGRVRERPCSPQSHVICLRVRSERPCSASHGLSRTRPHRFESPIGLSRTPGDAVILGPVWLISRLNALLRPVESDRHSDSAPRSDRPLTHLSSRCSPERPSALKSERPCAWEAVLPDWLRQITWQIVWGRGDERPMRGRKWEAVRGRERPCSSHWLRDLGQTVPDLAEPMRGARPHTASHGLSRPPRNLHRKWLKSLTFDSNSTSDRKFYQMC